MAAALRKDPGVEVELIEGRYGEFTVLVNDQEVIDAGALAILGVVPSIARIREVVNQKLAGS